MVTQNGQISYSQLFLQPIPKQKKLTSYTPFCLIFGFLIHLTFFDSSNLLNLITSPTDPGMNSHMLTEFETTDEGLPEGNDPYEVSKDDDDEWIESITSIRKDDKMTAIQNVKKNKISKDNL